MDWTEYEVAPLKNDFITVLYNTENRYYRADKFCLVSYEYIGNNYSKRVYPTDAKNGALKNENHFPHSLKKQNYNTHLWPSNDMV